MADDDPKPAARLPDEHRVAMLDLLENVSRDLHYGSGPYLPHMRRLLEVAEPALRRYAAEREAEGDT